MPSLCSAQGRHLCRKKKETNAIKEGTRLLWFNSPTSSMRSKCFCLIFTVIKPSQFNKLSPTLLLKIQMSSSWGPPDLRQTHRGGGACSRHKGLHLEEVRSLHTSLLIFKVLDLTQVPSVYALTAYHHFSLDDLMQFTCVQQPQKLYCRRLHTVMGICFWFGLERIIIVFHWYYGSREKCAKAHSHFIKALYPQDLKILQFLL